MDKRTIKIACIQFKPVRGEINSNIHSVLTLCRQDITKGTQVFVLPEMCLLGYIWDSVGSVASYVEDAMGESFQKISAFCKENECFMAYGFAEILNDQYFNSQNLVSPEGKLLRTYRKKNLFDADTFWATPGTGEYVTVNSALGKIGLGICMDLNFDEFVQFHIEKGTEYLLLAVNWLDEGV